MLLIFSCSNGILENQKVNNEILHFDTEDQMKQELNAFVKMTSEEKANWTSVKGFNSYGVQADLFYDNIDPESFKSEDEIIQFVKSSKCLKITTDENNEKSVEIVFGDNRLRYFINDELIFTVGDKAVKLIGESTVSTCIDNLSELKRIDDISQLENNSDYTIKDPKAIHLKSVASCPLEDSSYPTNGRYRLVMEVYAKEYYKDSKQTVEIAYKVKSQKRSIFWFAYTTDITYSIDMRAYTNYQTFGGTILSTSRYIVDSGSKNVNSIEDEDSMVISWPNQINSNLRWAWYRVNVSTANVSKDFKCGI